MKLRVFVSIIAVTLAFTSASNSHAETGYEAWLRYAPLETSIASQYKAFPANIDVVGNSAILQSARQELIRGIEGMLGTTLRPVPSQSRAFHRVGNN